MNEQTLSVLTQMADKLGTTATNLWGILMAQAPISATIDLVYLVFMVVILFLFVKLHLHLSVSKKRGGSNYEETAYEGNEGLVIGMIGLGLLVLTLFLVAFFSIGNIFNGYFNPEYWALEKILYTIGK